LSGRQWLLLGLRLCGLCDLRRQDGLDAHECPGNSEGTTRAAGHHI
jgi:hypothetical protein